MIPVFSIQTLEANMNPFISILILWTGFSFSCSRPTENSDLNFYGADSQEALLQYRTYFLFPVSKLKDRPEKSSDGVVLDRSDRLRIGKALKLHVLHLYGVFTYHEKPIDFSSYSGSIMERGKSNIESIQYHGSKYLKITYTYSDRTIFYKGLLTKKQTNIKFLMPTSPLEIYSKGFPSRLHYDVDGNPINTCTSHHDNSERAFWYYWSPDYKGCPKAFRKELHYVDATLTASPSTKLTYPEYLKLYSQNRGSDNRGRVRVDLIVGPDEDMSNPKDLGRLTYDYTYKYFAAMRDQNNQPTFQTIVSQDRYKVLRYQNQLFDADIHVHFRSPDETGFFAFAGNVMKLTDLFIYSGHSYEGRYFNLQKLFQAGGRGLPLNKYQIMFFNACTTYSYYNFNYFKAKRSAQDPRGTKNLDLMTNGIGTPFLLDGNSQKKAVVTSDIITIASLLGLRLDGKPLNRYRSWQEILGRISTNAGYDNTGLTSVMGDEDNPTMPPKLPMPIKK